ncbi:MAG: DUF2282 domain-containing protein [Hyphomicrobiaceae bacterium]
MDEKMKKGTAALAVAGAFAAMLAMSVAEQAKAADDMEKCFGIAKAAENECAAEGHNSCAGTSTVDYDGKAWKLVQKGTCATIETPYGTGSLEPIEGRPPA